MKRIFTACLFVVLALSLAAAPAVAGSTPEMLVTTDWLSAHAADPGLVLLHVGMDRKAYDAGHIVGARLVPWGNVTVTRNGVPNQLLAPTGLKAALEKLGIGDDSRVVIYGDTPLLAAHVYFALEYLGHGEQAALLDGGLEKWKADKGALSTEVPVVKPATLTVKLRPELVLDMATVQKIAAAKTPPLIDGRPPDQFTGAKPGDGIPRGGHIPGARNMFWMQTLVSKENPVLKPAGEIRALYEAAGAKPGEPVVVYCRTGPIAMHEYFTLKLAGFRPLLYNGSFMEWSNATGTPVESGVVSR